MRDKGACQGGGCWRDLSALAGSQLSFSIGLSIPRTHGSKGVEQQGASMRPDMKWIIGDQRGSRLSGPRKGRRFSPAEFRKFDWDIDDAPFVGGLVGHALEKSLIGSRGSTGRGFTRKPLERYLARQVGRLWNDVLSDMRTALRRADIAEAHWPYLWSSAVAVNARQIDGDVWVVDWHENTVPLAQAPRFYIDQQSGRLHRNTAIETPRIRKKRIEAAKAADAALRLRMISPTLQLHRLKDGLWWEVTLTELTWKTELEGSFTDVVLKAGLSNLPRDSLYGRPRVFASAKRQLSGREIKKHGLQAD